MKEKDFTFLTEHQIAPLMVTLLCISLWTGMSNVICKHSESFNSAYENIESFKQIIGLKNISSFFEYENMHQRQLT